jgi:hypothetical protein
MGELIDLDAAREARWRRILEEHMAMGRAAIFGVVGETEATIIQFPDVV